MYAENNFYSLVKLDANFRSDIRATLIASESKKDMIDEIRALRGEIRRNMPANKVYISVKRTQ